MGMRKQSVIDTIMNYENHIDTDEALNRIDNALKEANLDYNNIITIFTYHRPDEKVIEFSILTSPTKNVKIKCPIKNV